MMGKHHPSLYVFLDELRPIEADFSLDNELGQDRRRREIEERLFFPTIRVREPGRRIKLLKNY